MLKVFRNLKNGLGSNEELGPEANGTEFASPVPGPETKSNLMMNKFYFFNFDISGANSSSRNIESCWQQNITTKF